MLNNRKEYAKQVMMGKIQKKKNAVDLAQDKIEGDAVAREVTGSEADYKFAGGSPLLNRNSDRRSQPKD